MARQPSKGPSQRQLRVGEEIRHALSTILMEGDLRDPDLEGVSITVSEVRPSPDLRNATAFVMPLAGEGVEAAVAALNRAAGHLRGRLGRMVHLKFTPALKFEADRSFDEASKIDGLLRDQRVARDLAAKPGADPAPNERDDGA